MWPRCSLETIWTSLAACLFFGGASKWGGSLLTLSWCCCCSTYLLSLPHLMSASILFLSCLHFSVSCGLGHIWFCLWGGANILLDFGRSSWCSISINICAQGAWAGCNLQTSEVEIRIDDSKGSPCLIMRWSARSSPSFVISVAASFTPLCFAASFFFLTGLISREFSRSGPCLIRIFFHSC